MISKAAFYELLPFPMLTLPMLELISLKAQGHKDFWNTSNHGHAGIHWIALAEYFQMSINVPGFQSFLRFFASFGIGSN